MQALTHSRNLNLKRQGGRSVKSKPKHGPDFHLRKQPQNRKLTAEYGAGDYSGSVISFGDDTEIHASELRTSSMADTSGGEGSLGTICKCATCNKDFYKPRGHVYKREHNGSGGKYKYFCTWSCMREYDRTHVKKKKQKEASYY